ncbi:hypothetical protein ACWD4J_29620 [Streptomyces sp. NPDC002577]
MTIDEDRQAALRLAEQTRELGRAYGLEPWRQMLRRISRGRLGQQAGWPQVPSLDTPWQDTISPIRTGWRHRAAKLHSEVVFGVDYKICRRCRLGWVEEPHTDPQYQRCGLAKAGLAALRADHPKLAWHTLGGHFVSAQAFWEVAGAGVPGGYQQRDLCRHTEKW